MGFMYEYLSEQGNKNYTVILGLPGLIHQTETGRTDDLLDGLAREKSITGSV